MQENNIEAIRRCFWKRLESLLKEKGYTKREEQWEWLGVSKSTLMNWKNGLALPGHLDLIRISDLLRCSIDYLINETVTVKAAAEDVQSAVKTTGLSEKAVEALQLCQECGAVELLNTISAMIISDINAVQMNDGEISKGNPAVKAGYPVIIKGNGTGVQGTGLIGALHRNLEASIAYEAENAKLHEMSKEHTTPEELDCWFDQKRKAFSAQTKLENSGYHMMLTCTTAAAEGQGYHEALKATYKKGGHDNGEYHRED